MKKVTEFIKKYKVYILAVLLMFFFFRSCSRGGNIKKLEQSNEQQILVIDSLSQKIDSIPEVVAPSLSNEVNMSRSSSVIAKSSTRFSPRELILCTALYIDHKEFKLNNSSTV